MIIGQPGFFTNYTSHSFLEKMENTLLYPIVTAVGRKVTISSRSNGKICFAVEKTRSAAVRVLCGVVAIVALPMTLLGLTLRCTLGSHRELVKKEKELLGKLREDVSRILQVKNSAHGGRELMDFSVLIEKLDEGTRSINQELSYEDLLLLKKGINFLCRYLQNHQLQVDTIDLKKIQSDIRTLYYDRFSGQHIARNLKEKGKISALGVTLQDLTPEEMKGQEQEADKESILEGIREAFTAQQTPASLTWLHGTQSPTIAAVVRDGFLKPAGHVRRDHGVVFCGENGKGTFGINSESVSGVSLDHGDEAITYAFGGIGFHEEGGLCCVVKPRETIEIYVQQMNEWLCKEEDLGRKMYIDYASNKSNLFNFHRHMKILMTLEPDLFEKEVIPILNQLIQKLEKAQSSGEDGTCVRRGEKVILITELSRTEVLEPVLLLFREKPLYTEEDREIIRRNCPIVFGATDIRPVERAGGNESGKIAVRVPSMIQGEYAYKGDLKIGQDLPFLFTNQQDVAVLRSYLQKKGIENVWVYNFQTLSVATQFAQFREVKKEKRSAKLA